MRSFLVTLCIVGCGSPSAHSTQPAQPPAARPASDGTDALQVESSVAVAVEPDPPEGHAAQIEQTTEEDTHTLVLTDGRLFGCTLLPVVDQHLIRRAPSRTVRDEGPVSVAALRTLEPPIESLRVPSAEGLCAPRRGRVRGRALNGFRPFAEVQERLAGCTRMSTFAFADCQPPQWLHYERFRHRIENLPRASESDDPRLAALLQDPDAILDSVRGGWGAERIDELPADWRRHLRRRQRSASVALAAEEISVVETHWQIGDERCPEFEGVTAGVFARDPGGPWRRVETPGGLPVGIFHDGARVVGLDLLGRLDPGDRTGGNNYCGGPPARARSHNCDGAAIAARRGADRFALLASLYWNFVVGDLYPTDFPRLYRAYGGGCDP